MIIFFIQVTENHFLHHKEMLYKGRAGRIILRVEVVACEPVWSSGKALGW